jgi:hypothetical protein
VKADSALVRAAGVVVLDAEPLEDFDRPVVHANRNTEMVLAHRPAHHFGHLRVEVQQPGHAVELLLRHFEFVELACHPFLLE